MARAEPAPQLGQACAQKSCVRRDLQWQAQAMIVDTKAALIVFQLYLSTLETIAVEGAEKGRQQFFLQALVRMVPFDIEAFGEAGRPAVFQNIHQHSIGAIIR